MLPSITHIKAVGFTQPIDRCLNQKLLPGYSYLYKFIFLHQFEDAYLWKRGYREKVGSRKSKAP